MHLQEPTIVPDGKSVAVVGGGILGMYLAWQLQERGAAVTLFERGPATGGLASPTNIGSFVWDRFYHVILLSDENLIGTLTRLGLESKLQWRVTKTGFYTDGALYSMSNSVEFLRFPPLSLLDKLRLGGTIFLASRIKNWRALESELSVDWLRKWSGDSVFDKIWLPLLKSKLGDNYKVASAAFIWAIIARMYAARRAGLKQEMFGYVEGGYATVLTALQRKLDEVGVKTLFNAKVTDLISGNAQVRVSTEESSQSEFDYAILTLPTGVISNLCPQLTQLERTRLDDVTYQGIICPSLLLKKALSPFYVTNITDDVAPFTGVIEMTALVDAKNFDGNALVYLPQYLTQDSDYWNRQDDEIFEDCTLALERMYPSFQRDHIIARDISRARQVLAVSTLDYSEKLRPAVRTSLNNVFILNSAQIANGTLNVNETLGVVNENFATVVNAMSEIGVDS